MSLNTKCNMYGVKWRDPVSGIKCVGKFDASGLIGMSENEAIDITSKAGHFPHVLKAAGKIHIPEGTMINRVCIEIGRNGRVDNAFVG